MGCGIKFSYKNYHFNYIEVIKLICMPFKASGRFLDRAPPHHHIEPISSTSSPGIAGRRNKSIVIGNNLLIQLKLDDLPRDKRQAKSNTLVHPLNT